MPLTYSTRETTEQGATVLELRDDARGQRARILPEIGATCVDYTVTHHSRTVHVIEPPSDFETLRKRPTGYATPILFPFPNRIRRGQWTFRGNFYQFEDTSAGGNHIHGLVYDRPWEVEMLRATPDAATCVLRLVSTDFEDIGRQYPFPFELMVTYTLRESSLALTFSATNIGEEDMPMGVGFHPYFAAPIGETTDPEDCIVTVPAAAYWELENFLPTGRVIPVSGDRDLRNGRPLKGARFDDVFTQIEIDEERGVSRCTIDDKGLGLRTAVESDPVFREIVVYTPPGRRAICFEPYTCPTDAPNLAARGLDVGLIVLPPEETFTGTMRVVSEPI